ncbi:hypothetical protein CQ12_38425 [Bradyrhizobium jicamae]|uniref:Uncharacterized protein n=1 Tax=Bradyrhizobium jicamae TaxID=280332 RepID=A0A0R3KBW8_9BRAD|nr:hypothetical protein CQ12_38425 [Bradyrhizobium jicamae]
MCKEGGQVNLRRVISDLSCLDRQNFLLAQGFAHNIKAARQRSVAKRAVLLVGKGRANGSDQVLFRISQRGLGFASAAAIAPMRSLERCIGTLRLDGIEADCTTFGSLGPDAVPNGLFCVFRHKLLELGLCSLMILVSQAGLQVGCCKLRPKVGRGQIYDLDRLEPRARRFNPNRRGGSPACTQRQNFFSAS